MEKMPKGLKSHKSTPVFTEATIPKGLLNRHNTKEGVWGRLIVLSGTITFVDLTNSRQIEASPERPVTIVPQAWHHLKVTGEVELKIDFYSK